MAAPPKASRLPLADALAAADALMVELAPVTERLAIAGSIRRRIPQVADIELVAIPKYEAVATGQPDLFTGAPSRVETDLLDARCTALRAAGGLADRPDKNGRPAWGRKFKRMVYAGIPVDLFAVVPPAEWGVVLALRTGPRDYAHQLVTHHGAYFVDGNGARRGGLLPRGLDVVDGHLMYKSDGRVLPTSDEADFFAALGLAWPAPASRI